eukprot:1144675-Pelagomonas_calceolata.AAC.3
MKTAPKLHAHSVQYAYNRVASTRHALEKATLTSHQHALEKASFKSHHQYHGTARALEMWASVLTAAISQLSHKILITADLPVRVVMCRQKGRDDEKDTRHTELSRNELAKNKLLHILTCSKDILSLNGFGARFVQPTSFSGVGRGQNIELNHEEASNWESQILTATQKQDEVEAGGFGEEDGGGEEEEDAPKKPHSPSNRMNAPSQDAEHLLMNVLIPKGVVNCPHTGSRTWAVHCVGQPKCLFKMIASVWLPTLPYGASVACIHNIPTMQAKKGAQEADLPGIPDKS